MGEHRSGWWRPEVELRFVVDDGLALVQGWERIRFVPDLAVSEVVLRLWPNMPSVANDGNRLTVTSVRVDGRSRDMALSSDRTLGAILLEGWRPAGSPITVELDFELVLGEDGGDRAGYDPDAGVAWFGSGFPLLSWVRGEGWTRDEPARLGGEAAVSEDFRLELAVTARTGHAVLGPGAPGPRVPSAGRTTHWFTAPAVRDVAVAVGEFDVLERDMDGVRVRIATPSSGTRVEPRRWADTTRKLLARLRELLGPFPYPELAMAIVPPQGPDDGIEFPASLQFGDLRKRDLAENIAHELAHQWFYALVGNNQARDPWLDEAFATYAEAVVTERQSEFRIDGVSRKARGHIGAPMAYWDRQRGGFDRYEEGVYLHGAAVLLEARRRAGPARFDAALRTYIATNAHRVARPADVEAAFAHLPEVVTLLRTYGAV